MVKIVGESFKISESYFNRLIYWIVTSVHFSQEEIIQNLKNLYYNTPMREMI